MSVSSPMPIAPPRAYNWIVASDPSASVMVLSSMYALFGTALPFFWGFFALVFAAATRFSVGLPGAKLSLRNELLLALIEATTRAEGGAVATDA